MYFSRVLSLDVWNAVLIFRSARSYIVQSLNSPFFPPHIGAEPGRAKEESRVQDNLHAHAQNAAIFPPKSGEKQYLEVFSRFCGAIF